MLTFIGLGLSKGDVSLQGLQEAREADFVYAELYTSATPGLDLQELERLLQALGHDQALPQVHALHESELRCHRASSFHGPRRAAGPG